MNLYLQRHVDHIDCALNMIERRDPSDDPRRLDRMDVLQQRAEISEFLRNDEGQFTRKYDFMAAITDEISADRLFSAWQANDGTEILYLLNQALAKGLAEAINRKNGVEGEL